MKSASFATKTPLQDMINAESKNNYSADDQVELIRLEAVNPDTNAKVALFESYLILGKWKQSDFVASASCLLDSSNVEQSKILGDLWVKNINKVAKSFDRDYFLAYFRNLKTSFLADKEHLSKLVYYTNALKNDPKFATRIKLMREETEHLEIIMAIKESDY